MIEENTPAGCGEERAETLLEKGLRRLGRTGSHLESDRKFAVWKVVLAACIKRHCGVTNRWFSEDLHMGSIYGISKAVAQEGTSRHQAELWRRLGAAISKA